LAAASIDHLLSHDPKSSGESRFESVRILLVAPLGVYFNVREEDRAVDVLAVWRI